MAARTGSMLARLWAIGAVHTVVYGPQSVDSSVLAVAGGDASGLCRGRVHMKFGVSYTTTCFLTLSKSGDVEE